VRQEVFNFLSSVQFTTGREPDVERLLMLDDAVGEAQEALEEVVKLRDKVRPAALATALSIAQDQVEAAEVALAEERRAERRDVMPDEFQKAWERQDVGELRGVLRRVVDYVEVRRGKGPLDEEGTVTVGGLTLRGANVGRANIQWSSHWLHLAEHLGEADTSAPEIAPKRTLPICDVPMLEWPGHRNDVPSNSHAEDNAKLMEALRQDCSHN